MLDGPVRATVQAALRSVTSIPSLSDKRSEFWVPHCQGSDISEDRQAQFKMIGFMTLFHITTNKTAPMPVSPALLLLCLDGPDAVDFDESFLSVLDERSAVALRSLDDWDGHRHTLSSLPVHEYLLNAVDVSLPYL